ncbi:MAG: 4Fe-4S binding protein, partial [Blautia sp.]|nr:4Fe-4S binding protein [Blautia sp.]
MRILEKMKNLTDKECPVESLRNEVKQSKCNECGKCVFGYEGAAQLIMTLQDITEKKGKSDDLALLQDLCGMIKSQCLCEDGIHLADACLYAFEEYGDVFEAHIAKKGCIAGVCKSFMTYHILAEECIGCGECIDACEEDAIIGKKRFVHIIDQDECIRCGACVDACEEDGFL